MLTMAPLTSLQSATASITNVPTTTVSTSTDPTKKWFFDLSPELRNQIYETLFKPALPRHLVHCYNHEVSQDSAALGLRSSSSGVNVLRTCKQVHAEAEPYLYRNTVILASASRSCHQLMTITATWLKEVGHNIAKSGAVYIGLTK